MSEPDLHVECELHGDGSATFVCQHLVRGRGRGFFTSEQEGDPRPDAWCFACEQVVNAAGEWNDETEGFAGITMICSGCYDAVQRRNRDSRPSLVNDGWCLGTRRDVLTVTPDHVFPTPTRVATLLPGAYIKALFYLVGDGDNGRYVQGERMWVRVTGHGDDTIIGTLDSDPATAGSLAAEALVEIPYDLVIDLHSEDD